jgi:hypothetical protein
MNMNKGDYIKKKRDIYKCTNDVFIQATTSIMSLIITNTMDAIIILFTDIHDVPEIM